MLQIRPHINNFPSAIKAYNKFFVVHDLAQASRLCGKSGKIIEKYHYNKKHMLRGSTIDSRGAAYERNIASMVIILSMVIHV